MRVLQATRTSLVGALIGACASLSVVSIQPQVVDTDFPALNETVTREVGLTLVDQSKVHIYDALRFTADSNYKMGPLGPRIMIAKDTIFEGDRIIEGNKAYCGAIEGTTSSLFFKIEISRSCFLFLDGKVHHALPNSWKIVPVNASELYFEKEKSATHHPNSFRRAVYYNGKSGNVIFFSYREFSGGLARPAFTQDLTFDLDEGNVVGVMGARFEIIEATNINITYRLLHKFVEQAE